MNITKTMQQYHEVYSADVRDMTKPRVRLNYRNEKRMAAKVTIALLIVAALIAGIVSYESWLNQNAKTHAEKMQEVKKQILADTHKQSFHAEIVMTN